MNSGIKFNLNDQDHLEYPSINIGIILKWILKKVVFMSWEAISFSVYKIFYK